MEDLKLKYISHMPLELPKTFPDYPSMGGYVLFAGVVRNINEGRAVTHLEYDAYPELAEKMIGEIITEVCKLWKLEFIECTHRLGTVKLGEVAVLVITGSVHRDEAYKANRMIIDRVKHEVPIWKKEFYVDGTSEWSKGCIHESLDH
ncbi:molybdenum cofactor biosynthesis protein MoaE [Leptospira sp. 96542]|nr:molybdenum cofactor biosynthesis protein MoaE [Leptospira sp. 96542]